MKGQVSSLKGAKNNLEKIHNQASDMAALLSSKQDADLATRAQEVEKIADEISSCLKDVRVALQTSISAKLKDKDTMDFGDMASKNDVLVTRALAHSDGWAGMKKTIAIIGK